jgi:uncharacterized protein
MQTRHAVATFNLMVDEGRNVAALIEPHNEEEGA